MCVIDGISFPGVICGTKTILMLLICSLVQRLLVGPQELVPWSATHSHTHAHQYNHYNYHLTSSSHRYQSTSQALAVTTSTPQYHPSTFKSTRGRLNPSRTFIQHHIELSHLFSTRSHHATPTHHPHHIPHHRHPRRSRPKPTSHRHTMLRQL